MGNCLCFFLYKYYEASSVTCLLYVQNKVMEIFSFQVSSDAPCHWAVKFKPHLLSQKVPHLQFFGVSENILEKC